MNAMYKGIGIVSALIAATACAGDGPNTLLERLAHEGLPLSLDAAAAVVEGRQTDVGILVDLAGREAKGKHWKEGGTEFVEYPPHDTKHLAMLLLGDLRASEGVPVLLRDIEYLVPKYMADGYELGVVEGPGWRPAVESLIKIGMPSVDPVVKKLSGYGDDCLGRRLCIVVLREILGPRLAKARLGIAIEEAENAAAEDPQSALARGALPPDKARLETTIRNLKAAVSVLHAQESLPVKTVQPIW
jgi:hypothetical protein